MPREKKEKRNKKKALSRKIHTAFNKHKRKTLIQSWKYRSLQLEFKSQPFHWVTANTGRVVQKLWEPCSDESPFLCLVLSEGKRGKVHINYSPFVSQTCTCKWIIPLFVLWRVTQHTHKMLFWVTEVFFIYWVEALTWAPLGIRYCAYHPVKLYLS